MKRYIYAFDTPESARLAAERLSTGTIDVRHISLIARSDIERNGIPRGLLDASTDLVPAIGRGAAVGGMTGLCAGLVFGLVPALGFGISGAELIAFVVGGALIGAWGSAFVGAAIPDAVRRTFEREIDAGRTLLVVDGNDVDILRAMSRSPDIHMVWQSDSSHATAA